MASQCQTAVCEKCDDTFIYIYRGIRRRVCDTCRQLGGSTTKKRLVADCGVRQSAKPAAQMTYEECAHLLGLHRSTVMTAEVSALKKLRKHPQLLALWGEARAAGLPAVEPRPDRAARLLEYQTGMAEWWAIHDRLKAGGCLAEAQEVELLIDTFRKRLEAELRPGGCLEIRRNKK